MSKVWNEWATREPKTLKREQDLVAQARELGAKAFRSGGPRAPALNQEVMRMLAAAEGHDAKVALMQAFLSGWDSENLSAPVPESLKREDYGFGYVSSAGGIATPSDIESYVLGPLGFKLSNPGEFRGEPDTWILGDPYEPGNVTVDVFENGQWIISWEEVRKRGSGLDALAAAIRNFV